MRSALLLLVCTAACGGASGPKAEPLSVAKESTKATQPAPAQATLEPAVAFLDLFPADYEVVWGVNGSKVRSSSVWTQTGNALSRALLEGLNVPNAAADCGGNPLDRIEWLLVGLRESGSDRALLVLGGVDKTKFECWLRSSGRPFESGDDLGVAGVPKENTIFFWPAERVVALVPRGGKHYAQELSERRGGLLKTEQPWVQVLQGASDLDTSAAAWFCSGEKMARSLGASVPGLSALYGDLILTKGLLARAVQAYATDSDAATVSKMMEAMVQEARKSPNTAAYFEGLRVTTQGSRVVVALKMGGGLLDRAADQIMKMIY